MSINKNVLKFKVLLGIHIGAEIYLSTGSYKIGNDIDADIVLNEKGVLGHHCTLNIRDNIIEIIPVKGQVYIEGKSIEHNGEKIDLLQPFQIGSCICCIGDSQEKRWPDPFDIIKSFDRREEKDELEEEKKNLKGTSSEERHKDEQQEDNGDQVLEREGENRFKSSVLVAASVLFLLFCAVFYFLFPSYPSSVNNGKHTHTLEEILKRYRQGFLILRVKNTPQGQEIMGIAKDINTKLNFDSEVRAEFPLVKENIVSLDELSMGIRDILDGYGARGISFTIENNGTLLLKGIATSRFLVKKIIKAIHHDMDDLLTIKDEVLSSDALKQEILQTFLSVGIRGRIEVDFTSDTINIQAVISRKERLEFLNVIRLLKKRYGSRLRLSFRVSYLENRVKLNVKGIYVGGVRYIIWANGKKYFEGARLPGGFILKRIRIGSLELEKGNITLSIPIGGG